MPRRPRVFIEGGIYHVYNRFSRGADVFRGAEEAERFLSLLRTARDRDGVTVFAWCVMSNHYHLVVRCGAVLLARTMGFVQARFAQGYNQRNRLIGPLWQGRYKAKLVEDERYLQQVVLYVHINPVTAGVVDEPAGYPLSGHRELLRSQPGGLVDAEQTLSLFGGSVRTARQRYVRALEGARQAEWREELPGALPWWGREPDRPLSPPAPSSWVDDRGVSSGLDRPQVAADAFVAAAGSALGLPRGYLTAPGSGRQVTRWRSLVAALAVERWRLRPAELGPLFRRRSDVVSRWVRWGVALRVADPQVWETYEKLDRTLATTLGGKGAP